MEETTYSWAFNSLSGGGSKRKEREKERERMHEKEEEQVRLKEGRRTKEAGKIVKKEREERLRRRRSRKSEIRKWTRMRWLNRKKEGRRGGGRGIRRGGAGRRKIKKGK